MPRPEGLGVVPTPRVVAWYRLIVVSIPSRQRPIAIALVHRSLPSRSKAASIVVDKRFPWLDPP